MSPANRVEMGAGRGAADGRCQVLPPEPATAGLDFRRIAERQVTNVAVVTAGQYGEPTGLRVNGLTLLSPGSPSGRPPLVSFTISATSSWWPTLEQAEFVGLHFLADDQASLAERFAPGRADGFLPPTSWRRGPYDVPVLNGCAAWSVGHPQQRVHAGDQVIVVAALLHGDAPAATSPLLATGEINLRPQLTHP